MNPSDFQRKFCAALDEAAEAHMEPYGVLKTQLSFKAGASFAIKFLMQSEEMGFVIADLDYIIKSRNEVLDEIWEWHELENPTMVRLENKIMDMKHCYMQRAIAAREALATIRAMEGREE